MIREWDRRKGEPSLWYGRFVEFYLGAGEERTLLGAYKTFRARHAVGTGAALNPHILQPSSQWKGQCAAWGWVKRAQAYDAHQAVQAQKARAAVVRKTNEKHLVIVQNNFTKLIKRLQFVDYSEMGAMELLRATEKLIHLERLLLGMPLTVEETRLALADPAPALAAQDSADSLATPEMMAEVFKILDAQGVFEDDPPAPQGETSARAS